MKYYMSKAQVGRPIQTDEAAVNSIEEAGHPLIKLESATKFYNRNSVFASADLLDIDRAARCLYTMHTCRFSRQ